MKFGFWFYAVSIMLILEAWDEQQSPMRFF